MLMLDSETVFQFQQRVYMITSALGRRPERVVEHQVILFSEIRPKLPVILREMLEGDQILGDFGMSWSEFWAKLEEIESSMTYQDRLLLHKNLGGGKLPSSDSKVPKGKEKAGTTQKGAGESGAVAGGSSSSSSKKKRGSKYCMRCGDRSHGTEDCKHPKASKIPLVDGKLPRICFKCFEAGHSKKFCPGEGKAKGASEGGSGGGSSKGATGAVSFCGAVPIANLRWAEERGVQEFLLDKEFGRGEILQDFQKGKPGGVFPVIDRVEVSTARLGIKALVPWELARELGAELRNIPKFFPRRALRSDDKKWIRGKEVFDKKKLEESQREKILLVIQDAMAENEKLPASTRCTLKGAKFRIEIKADARPTNKPQYPICERFWEQVKQRGKEWIKKGWVKLWPPGSTPEWHSPLLAVKKVSGNKWNRDIRLCMDFRAPNSVTEDPTYPVPLLREMLSRLVGKKIFSELDLVDAYHQIALDEESMECTTFTIPGVGKAYWVVLFFGAKGAVAFFQKIIEGALGEISVDIVIVIYVDNILVASLEFEQHAREVEIVI